MISELLLEKRKDNFSKLVITLDKIIGQSQAQDLSAVKREIENAKVGNAYRESKLIQIFFAAANLKCIKLVTFLVNEKFVTVDSNFESIVDSELSKFPDETNELQAIKARNNNWNVFFHAISGNSTCVLKFLLDQATKNPKKFDITKYISEPEGRKITLLHQVMSYTRDNPKESVNLLLAQVPENQRNQFISQKTNHDETALHFAAQNGHADSAGVFFSNLTTEEEKLQLIEQKTKKGLHSLMVACDNKQNNVVKLLLEQFKDDEQKQRFIKEVDSDGNSALHFAAQSGDADSVNLLFSHLNDEKKLQLMELENKARLNALMAASGSGHNIVVKLLIEQFHNNEQKQNFIKKRNSDGKSALYFTAESGHVDTAKSLLDNLDEKNQKIELLQEAQKGRTLLSTACAKNHADFVQLLLEKSHDKFPFIINYVDNKGNTPLHLAAKNGNLDSIKVLFKNIEPNEKLQLIKKKNLEGSAALGLAAYHNRPNVVELLLKNFDTADGKYELIKQTNCKENTSLHAAYKSTACIRILLADLSAQQKEELSLMRNGKGNTVLHLMAKDNTVDSANFLLKNLPQKSKTALLSQVDNEGKNVLDLAIDVHSDDTAVLLIKNGAIIKGDDAHFDLNKFLTIEPFLKNERKRLHRKKNKKHVLFGAVYAGALLSPIFSLPILVKILELNLSCIKYGILTDEIICLSFAVVAALIIISTAIYFHNKTVSVLSEQEKCCDNQLKELDNLDEKNQKIELLQEAQNERILLSTACAKNHADFVQLLLEKYHDKFQFIINNADDKGNTPLHLAAKNGSLDSIEVLFNNLTQDKKLQLIQKKNSNRTNSLGLAAYHNRPNVVELLLKNFDAADGKYELIKQTNCKENTSLHAAYKSTACIRILLADLSAQQKEELSFMRNGQGNTVLHLMAKDNTVDSANFLLKNLPQKSKTALLSQVDNEGKSVLDLAIDVHSDDTAVLLIKNGAIIKGDDAHFDLNKFLTIEPFLKNERKRLHRKKNKKHVLFGAVYAGALLSPIFSLPILVNILDLNLSCIKSGILTDEIICLSFAVVAALIIISTAIYFHNKTVSVLSEQEKCCDNQLKEIDNYKKNLKDPKRSLNPPNQLQNNSSLQIIPSSEGIVTCDMNKSIAFKRSIGH